jgi:hypothetical protein
VLAVFFAVMVTLAAGGESEAIVFDVAVGLVGTGNTLAAVFLEHHLERLSGSDKS